MVTATTLRRRGGPGAAALALAFALAACGLTESRPTDYYLLDPIRPSADRPAADGGMRLALEEIEIPSYLDRQDIVTRDTETRLRVSGVHQWAEPLSANVARVLAENLRLLLDETEVIALPTRRAGFDTELQVELLRFEQEAGGDVVLVATWVVLSGDRREEMLHRRATLRAPVDAGAELDGGPDYDAVVGAMTEALGALSRRIADSLKQAGAAA